jgi:uncharacterized protein YgbK (DUF1537 family)
MGHLFVGDRLLNESGMQNHPLTPMTDPDIRRWLRLQTRGEVGGISLDTVRGGVDALRAAFAREAAAGRRLVVTDAVADSDLMTIGTAATDHKLVTGGSGIAQGLPQNFRAKGKLAGKAAKLPVAAGRGIVLCGSCSTASQNQVANYIDGHPGLAVDPGEVMLGRMTVERAVAWIGAQDQVTPIVYSTAAPKAVSDAQAEFGREAVAARIETFFADLARRLADTGTKRFVVGGGETSGAIVEALGLASMQVGPEIDPGVPVLVGDRGGPIGLALKSGNFGAKDFFAKALVQVGRP